MTRQLHRGHYVACAQVPESGKTQERLDTRYATGEPLDHPEYYGVSGRIDHAHHENRAKLVLQETLEFDEAVNETVRVLPENETLIVVTADHSHTMTIAGHPSRGTNILGM
ncbi:hypothetical protein MTO96_033611 [Rhipicephalus appendiculatus]